MCMCVYMRRCECALTYQYTCIYIYIYIYIYIRIHVYIHTYLNTCKRMTHTHTPTHDYCLTRSNQVTATKIALDQAMRNHLQKLPQYPVFTAIPGLYCPSWATIIEGRFQVFVRCSSSKLVPKTVEICFVALNYHGNGSATNHD